MDNYSPIIYFTHLLIELGQFDRTVFNQIGNVHHSHIAASLNNLANIANKKGEFDRALNYYRPTLDIKEKNYSIDHM